MHYDGTTLEAVEVETARSLLGGSYVWAMEAAPNGDLWVGGFLGGNPGVSGTGVEPLTDPPVLARFDGERWTVYDSPPYDPTGNCYGALLDLAVGPDGVVWWASMSGLVSFDGTEWTTHIDGRWVGSVDVAPDGTVWYADDYGIHTLTTAPILTARGLDGLAAFRAGPVPADAVCPPGSTPDTPGDPTAARPTLPLDEWGTSAAFDRESGLLVLSVNGSTWTFDPCWNRWEEMGSRDLSSMAAPWSTTLTPT